MSNCLWPHGLKPTRLLCPWNSPGKNTGVGCQSLQFSHSVVSDSLRPRELQHARPPCPSPTPGVYSNSCPLSRWCHPTIPSSVVPFSSCNSLIQDQTQVSCVAGGFFTVWATREAHTWTKENVISIWGKFRMSYYISFINDIKRADKIFLTSICNLNKKRVQLWVTMFVLEELETDLGEMLNYHQIFM